MSTNLPVAENTHKRLAKVKEEEDGHLMVPASDLAEFRAQTPEKQGKLTQGEWRETAWLLARRAKELARCVTKNNAGRVQQAVTAAAIAYDKLYKGSDAQSRGPAQVLIALFGNSGVGERLTRNLTAMLPPDPQVIDAKGEKDE